MKKYTILMIIGALLNTSLIRPITVANESDSDLTLILRFALRYRGSPFILQKQEEDFEKIVKANSKEIVNQETVVKSFNKMICNGPYLFTIKGHSSIKLNKEMSLEEFNKDKNNLIITKNYQIKASWQVGGG